MWRILLALFCASALAVHAEVPEEVASALGIPPSAEQQTAAAPTPSATPVPIPNAPPINVSLSSLSAYLQAKSKRHSYGYAYVRGAPRPLEFLR